MNLPLVLLNRRRRSGGKASIFWILYTGLWDDGGFWVDVQTWTDGA